MFPDGQTIAVNTASSTSTLALLGASHNGPVSTQIKLTYSTPDSGGSYSSVQIVSVPDWWPLTTASVTTGPNELRSAFQMVDSTAPVPVAASVYAFKVPVDASRQRVRRVSEHHPQRRVLRPPARPRLGRQQAQLLLALLEGAEQSTEPACQRPKRQSWAAMSQGSTEITVPEVRALATALLPEVATLAEDMLEYILERIPEAGGDDELRGLTLGSCSSNLEAALSMVRHGIDVSAATAPVTALEHARAMAARGLQRRRDAALLPARPRVLHRAAAPGSPTWSPTRISARCPRGAGALRVRVHRPISSEVAAEYVAELERRQNRVRAARTDWCATLFAGDQGRPRAAERVSSHRLTGGRARSSAGRDGMTWTSRASEQPSPGSLGPPPLLDRTAPRRCGDGSRRAPRPSRASRT